MEQFCGMLALPRHITWPIGFALTLLVVALVTTALRKRSQTWAATSVQAWAGFAVMLVISGLIFVMLPQTGSTAEANFFVRAQEAAEQGHCGSSR